MSKIVVKIGGSISIGENGPIRSYFERLVPVLKKVKEENELYVVIGGGKIARNYYNSIKDLLPHDQAEWVLIDILHANGRTLAYLIDAKFAERESDVNGAPLVASGFEPGHSSDGTAAIIAEKVRADKIIILTDVDGVYTKDPKKIEDAELIESIKFEDALSLSQDGAPVNYGVVDKTALEIISKNRITTHIVGSDPENIIRVLNGEKIGTTIEALS